MDCTTCISRQTPRTIYPCTECIAMGGQHPGKTYPRYRADYAMLASKLDENSNVIDNEKCVNYDKETGNSII